MASVTEYEFLIRYQERSDPLTKPAWERVLSTRMEYAIQTFRFKFPKERYKIVGVYKGAVKDWDKY